MCRLPEAAAAYVPVEEKATLQYLKWRKLYETEKPYQLFSAVTEQDLPLQGATNLEWTDGHEETIHDVRGTAAQFILDTNGFAFRNAPTTFLAFDSPEQMERTYLPEAESILRHELEGVDQVHFFDWRIRKNTGLGDKTEIDANDKSQHLLPATHVHVDQTPAAVVGRVRLHLPAQADFLLRGRVRIINLWRPIVEVVEDRPLALCDARTVRLSDLVEADHVRRHYSGANYYAKPSDSYRWYYLNRQRRDEVTLLKMFDSADVQGKYCLHTSFSHTTISAGAVPRESIEVRALVFTYPHDEGP